VKLGLSGASYRWVWDRRLRRDQPAFNEWGLPPPYFSPAPTGIDEANAADFLIDRAVQHGLQVLHFHAGLVRDLADAREKARRMADHGIEWVSSAWANWVATGEAFERDYAAYMDALRLSAAAGARVVCTTHLGAAIHNHFSKHPPVATQITIMTENLARAARVAASEGLVLAFENHLDYRASEIAQVVEGVGSPALRVNFDTANPIAVIEDPVDAARRVARYAVMSHVKDFLVQPSTVTGVPRIHWAPIGRGSVDFDAIFAILQAGAADAGSLRLCVEVAPLPEHDPDFWVRDSLRWVRERYATYL